MKILLHKLTLRAKKETFEIPFSDSITYFYGKMGAGKSTIPRLIDFCLGADLKETPALQHEFVSANLELTIGNNHVNLERERGSNIVIAAWRKLPKGDPVALPVPVHGTKDKSLIPNTKVENISDFIFYLAGLEPPFVLKSKYEVDTELVRLSIRDLMWYCYLDQDHLDSSFYYLERSDNPFKTAKSRDAMRFILGLRYEKIAKLENDLVQAREEKSARIASINQLKNFLEENGIKTVDDIKKQIVNSEEELAEVKQKINLIRKETFVQDHPIDAMKENRRRLDSFIDQIKQKIEDIEFQISNQNRLKSEFITANMKLDRTTLAREVFRSVRFNTCPQCGQHVNTASHDICSLCKTSPKKDIPEDIKLMSPELIERVKEIESSVSQLTSEQKQLQLILKSRLIEKSDVDKRLSELEREYDSKYLSSASQLLQRKGTIEGTIQYLNHILSLPQKVEYLEKEAGELAAVIERLSHEIEKEKEEARKSQTVIKELEKMFADTLKQVCFPGIKEDNEFVISPDTFIPVIYPKDKNDPTFATFYNLGSGGKKTIFKSCFALALHRLASKRGSNLPTFLIIDTPMKNISERENEEVFKSFYQFIYKLSRTELMDRQIIIIDKEYYESKEKEKPKIIVRHMTPADPNNPPLIGYYQGQ
ncbi:MAG: AAA family ATPase [Rhabdochlamydiaceae bacterium]